MQFPDKNRKLKPIYSGCWWHTEEIRTQASRPQKSCEVVQFPLFVHGQANPSADYRRALSSAWSKTRTACYRGPALRSQANNTVNDRLHKYGHNQGNSRTVRETIDKSTFRTSPTVGPGPVSSSLAANIRPDWVIVSSPSTFAGEYRNAREATTATKREEK